MLGARSRPINPRYDPAVENFTLTELDSGERVISEQIDHVRSVAVGYWIGAGSRDELLTKIAALG